jgi:hypothetical protein
MSSQLNYTDLIKQALQSNINPVETVENHIPITGPSNYPFEGKQYVYVNPCTECKKKNPKPGHNCWKYS